MRPITLSSILLLLLSFAVTHVPAADATAPAALVSALYKAHDNNKSPFFQTDDKARLTKHFTKELADLIWKDAKESNGEVGALDFDPLYDAQDTEIKKFAIQPAKITEGKATVLVNFVNMGEKQQITFRLMQEAGAWKIADIQYSAGHTLLGLFKAAAKEN